MANLTEFSLAEAIAVLTRTPATLNALLRGLPNIWVCSNEGKDTWSALDIVGHLIVAVQQYPLVGDVDPDAVRRQLPRPRLSV